MKNLYHLAIWAILEEARRRAMPKSVMDVAPKGYVVPWSEVRAIWDALELPKVDVVTDRHSFQLEYDKAKRHLARKGGRHGS